MTGKMTRGISAARAAAFQTLETVAGSGYASDALREAAKGLTARDAGLAAQIVFGSLRYQGQLDYLISVYSGRRVEKLDEPVKIALRTALFQMHYLERIPVWAAVHESVEFAKIRARSAAGLVNAVLRKAAAGATEWPDISTELSCPFWLIERWTEHFGGERARGIAAAGLQEPVPYIRVPAGESPPGGSEVIATEVPGAFRLVSEIPVGVRLYDISSQSIIPLLGLSRSDTYLDLCAAPGNKTMQALETPPSLAIACDVSLRRMRDVPPICPRVVVDASSPLPFNRQFSRIFLDAPCSGTGTLSRNPEIKWRLKPEDLARFHDLQSAILMQAVQLLEPGGRLVYATCSLEREENENVTARALATGQVFLTAERWRLPGKEEGDGFYAAVLEPEQR